MLRMTTTKSAENFLLDMAENTEVDSKTSSITRSAKNSSASENMAKDAKIDKGDSGDDETVKKLLFSKSQMYLWGILSPYALKKDEFLLIVFGHCWSFQLKALLEKL